MGSAAFVLIAVIVLGIFGWFIFAGGLGTLRERERGLPDAATEVRYRVPEGQDTAALLAVLTPAGFAARAEDHQGTRVLVVQGAGDPRADRAAIRALIAEANSTIQDPVKVSTDVHFLDEGA